jgi:hypothetical protein
LRGQGIERLGEEGFLVADGHENRYAGDGHPEAA